MFRLKEVFWCQFQFQSFVYKDISLHYKLSWFSVHLTPQRFFHGLVNHELRDMINRYVFVYLGNILYFLKKPPRTHTACQSRIREAAAELAFRIGRKIQIQFQQDLLPGFGSRWTPKQRFQRFANFYQKCIWNYSSLAAFPASMFRRAHRGPRGSA